MSIFMSLIQAIAAVTSYPTPFSHLLSLSHFLHSSKGILLTGKYKHGVPCNSYFNCTLYHLTFNLKSLPYCIWPAMLSPLFLFSLQNPVSSNCTGPHCLLWTSTTFPCPSKCVLLIGCVEIPTFHIS